MLNRLYPTLQPQQAKLEIELLLICAQRNLTPTQVDRLKNLVEVNTLKWDVFVEMVIEHRIYPLVLWNVNRYIKDHVPPSALEALQRAFSESLFANTRARREQIHILQAFNEKAIDVICVRGPILAQWLYDEIWLREFKDIDILVKEEDFQHAEALFLELGYEREGEIEDNAYNQKLLHPDKYIEVELHWAMDAPFMQVDAHKKYYWDHAMDFNFEGITAKVFQPEDTLLMLCYHGAKHRWNRLKWLCDISEFVRKFENFDWNLALQQAEAIRVKRILLLNLWLTHILFQTILPPIVQQSISEDPVVLRLGNYIRQWLFHQSERRFIDQIRGMLFFLLIREGSQDRVASIRHALRYPKSPILRRFLSLISSGKVFFLA